MAICAERRVLENKALLSCTVCEVVAGPEPFDSLTWRTKEIRIADTIADIEAYSPRHSIIAYSMSLCGPFDATATLGEAATLAFPANTKIIPY